MKKDKQIETMRIVLIPSNSLSVYMIECLLTEGINYRMVSNEQYEMTLLVINLYYYIKNMIFSGN